jgi:hypothetical protein
MATKKGGKVEGSLSREMKVAAKHNPQDATRRNIQASNKKFAKLNADVREMKRLMKSARKDILILIRANEKRNA